MRLIKSIKDFLFDSGKFRMVLLLSMFLSNIAFVDVVATIVTVATGVWSILVLYLKVKNGQINKIQYSRVIFLYILSNAVTIVLHYNINLPLNCLYIYFTTVCLMSLYGLYVEKDHVQIKVEMFAFFKMMILLTGILSFLSLLTLFLPNGVKVVKNDFIATYKSIFSLVGPSNIDLKSYTFGIYESRLIGVYTNANMIGFSSAIGVIFCYTVIYREGKALKSKINLPVWFLCGCMISNLICLLLSDSNASLLFIIIYFTVIVFCKVLAIQEKLQMATIAKKSIILLFVCVFMISGCFTIRKYSQHLISNILEEINQADNEIALTTQNNLIEYDTETVSDDGDQFVIGRNTDNTDPKDYSSGRNVLLKNGLKLFRRYPFGISRAGLWHYWQLEFGVELDHSDLHNGYLTVLVSFGVIGFGLFIIFGLLLLRKVCAVLFIKEILLATNVFPRLFSFLIAYCVYALFEITFFSEPMFAPTIFWIILGYVMSFTVEYTINTEERATLK